MNFPLTSADFDRVQARSNTFYRSRLPRYWSKDPGATTITSIGLGTLTPYGSSTVNSDSTNGVGRFVQCITAASSGSTAGLASAFTITRLDWKPCITFHIVTGPNATSIRNWVGLFSSSPNTLGSISSIHGMGFGYDTGTDGSAFWYTATANASSQTRTATAIAYTASTEYSLTVDASSGASVEFRINDEPVFYTSATLPTSTQLLGFEVSATSLAAAAKRISVGSGALVDVG